MNVYAKMPFDPFVAMKTVFPIFNNQTKVNDPYHPYQFNQQWLQDYQAISQQFLQGWWDLIAWQHWSWQQALYENSRWLSHCMQLTRQPQTLYRYTRMNWQKPLLGLNAQALTSTRLMTQLWVDTFNAWQQTVPGMKNSRSPHAPDTHSTKPSLVKNPLQKRKH